MMEGPNAEGRNARSIYDYIFQLEQELRALKLERERLEDHAIMWKRKYYQLKRELDRLLRPPFVVGVVLDILGDRAIVKNSSGMSFVVPVLSNLQDKLKPGMRVALSQQTLAVVEILPPARDVRARAAEVIERPNVKYSDIGGLKEQIREIREVVELPLKNPDLFREIGITPPKGILLYGPPGTGKTLLAKAVATEVNATFLHVVGSELVQKFIGEGAQLVREIFAIAKEKRPSIIFIDEIDAIGAVRTATLTGGDREVQRTLMQLLAEMDGFKPLEGVVVIGATNRIDILDPALLRPGRFDRLIEIPLPDEEGRYEIFRIHTRKMKLRDVNLRKLAKMTAGASGAAIKAICTEAGFFAIRAGRKYVTMKDFEQAIAKVLEGKKEKSGIHG